MENKKMICKNITTKLLRKLLTAIKNQKDITASDIYRNHNISYAHVHNTSMKLREDGLVTTKKVGRENLINITEKGLELLDCLNKLNQLYKGVL